MFHPHLNPHGHDHIDNEDLQVRLAKEADETERMARHGPPPGEVFVQCQNMIVKKETDVTDQDWKTGGLNREKYVLKKRCPACNGEGFSFDGQRAVDIKCHTCDGECYVPVDPKATYFVLRIDCDPETGEPHDWNARAALFRYVHCVKPNNEEFAGDIIKWLEETRSATAKYDKPTPDYGELMMVKRFRASCADGAFIDYDGHGHPVRDGMMADDMVFPSRYQDVPKDATHIMWFNR